MSTAANPHSWQPLPTTSLQGIAAIAIARLAGRAQKPKHDQGAGGGAASLR
jgi:hypothetical protein